MKKILNSIYFFFPVILLSVFFFGCGNQGNTQNDRTYSAASTTGSPAVSTRISVEGSRAFSSYHDIPGVTKDEITAIEEIRKQTGELIFGMLSSTEAFLNTEGEIRGYSALFCEWLTDLFDIKFTVNHYSWFGLLDGLRSGEVSFTGELTANDERRKTYFMTGTIAQRFLKYFRIEGSMPIAEIAQTRLPRYILQEKTTIATDVLYYRSGKFEPVFIHEYDEAYNLLKTGAADTLITEGVQEAYWNTHGDIIVTDFFPLIYSPVSLSTQNPKLEPIISVVQKALDNGITNHLTELYELGHREYLKHKLYSRFSSDELAYIKNNPVIQLGAEYDNYPNSYYNQRYEKWQGIAHDVLEEVASLTGLEFKVIHGNNLEFYELLQMLEDGEIDILSEVIRSPEREGLFLWPDNSVMTDRSVLISRADYRRVTLSRIYSERIGLNRGTAHAEFFHSWFPNHPNVIEYDSQAESFDALMKGEVDLVMNSYSSLLNLINYLELPDYKANIMFDNNFASAFGFNIEEKLLCSIIDKALAMIDTETISEQWRHKTYDYRLKLEQARIPWLRGSIILSLLVLSLVVILFLRSRLSGKELERLVKRRTHQLAFQTATLSTWFDSIPDLIFTKDLNLNFLHCNKAFLEHFNKGMDEVTGSCDSKEMGMTDEEVDTYNYIDRKVINERRIFTIEEHIPRFDGTKPLYETIKMPLVLNDRVEGILGVARDITKRKEAEAAALAASRSKSSFLANMSHEIRTPMNAIFGVTEILIQNEEIPNDIEEGLNKIYTSCDLLLGIINDILDFSKIEAGKIDIMPVQYKVASMINDSVHLNMMRIESKPIEFELQVNENVPAKLLGDELRIKQILNNLLSNAFKYTESGNVILSIHTEPAENAHVTLVLGVKDTGRGMSKEQLSKIFEEYSRFDERVNKHIEGTGLGLAITHRLISLMGGQIHVESEPNKGTLFMVRLPQETVDDEMLGKDVIENLRQFRKSYMIHRRKGQIDRDPMPYGKVLVVDDIETNLYIAAGLLRLYKLQVDVVMSGQEAIDKIAQGCVYDIIFMDHMMPEMDGLEAAKHIRDLGYTSPIIALTANAVTGQADIFMKNGFNEFISKPIDIRQLDSILNIFIRDKQPPEVIKAARSQKIESSAGTQGQIDSLLIESFVRDANKAINWLDEALVKNDFEDDAVLKKFTVIVHGIKSTFWNIKEKELGDLALKLEIGGREHDINLIKTITPQFLDKLRALLEKQEFKRGGNESGENEDIEKLNGALNAIKEKASDYDRKGVLDIIADIKIYSKETKAVLDIITEHVLHSEFDEAIKAAEEYMGNIAKL